MRSSFLNRPIELNNLLFQTMSAIQRYRDWGRANFITTGV